MFALLIGLPPANHRRAMDNLTAESMSPLGVFPLILFFLVFPSYIDQFYQTGPKTIALSFGRPCVYVAFQDS